MGEIWGRDGGEMGERWGEFTCRTCCGCRAYARAGVKSVSSHTWVWAVNRCGVRRTHAGASHLRPLRHAATGAVCGWAEEKKERWRRGATVKDRGEPCHIQHVLQVKSPHISPDLPRSPHTSTSSTSFR